jgi:predicted ATPase/DNA-binding CsgD family transcriptional regulator
LAQAAATNIAGDFGDGAHYVALASLDNPGLVLDAIASALELAEQGRVSRLEQLQATLWSRRVLLVLDNFEHVMDAGPPLAQLLAECPLVKMLVTSRERLHLSAEQEFVVKPLAAPPADGDREEMLGDSPAVELFVQRALAVRRDFRLVDANAAVIGAICRRLDGLPLAIELAAMRANLLSPEELLDRLDRPLEMLTGGHSDVPARHRELRATIAWSYDLLDRDERQTFRALAAFAGGCSLESAEAVCRSEDGGRVLDRLGSLVDKGLVRRAGAASESRLEMLETIREFALEKLTESGEEEERRAAHARHFVAVAEEAGENLSGHGQVDALHRLSLDHANLRTALHWYLDHGDGENALKICTAPWRRGYWLARSSISYIGEGEDWLQRALGCYGPRETPLRATALATLGTLSFFLGRVDDAGAACDEALALSQRLEDRASIVHSTMCRARIFRETGMAADARPLLEEALGWAQELDEMERALLQQQLGFVAISEENFDEARRLLGDSLATLERRGERLNVALNLLALAFVMLPLGDAQEALRFAERSFSIARELGERWRMSLSLLAFGCAAVASGRPAAGVQLLSCASRTREETGGQWMLYNRTDFERSLEAGRAALSDEAFAAAWATGQTLTLDEAHTLALGDEAPGHAANGGSLTAREWQVLQLIADGLSDAEIAKRLVVSPRTVHAHLRSIYRKLGVTSRAAARSYAQRASDEVPGPRFVG